MGSASVPNAPAAGSPAPPSYLIEEPESRPTRARPASPQGSTALSCCSHAIRLTRTGRSIGNRTFGLGLPDFCFSQPLTGPGYQDCGGSSEQRCVVAHSAPGGSPIQIVRVFLFARVNGRRSAWFKAHVHHLRRPQARDSSVLSARWACVR